MRAVLTDNHEPSRKLAALEKELKDRLDVHESAIVDILRRLTNVIESPALTDPSTKPIGFTARERRGPYRVTPGSRPSSRPVTASGAR